MIPPHPRPCSFAGCDLLHGVGWLVAEWAELRWLDLSGTGADDADVEALAALALHRLDLSACCRVKGRCLQALARSPGVQVGHCRVDEHAAALTPGSFHLPAVEALVFALGSDPVPLPSPAEQLGWLTELRLSDLAWVGAQVGEEGKRGR